MYIVSYNAKTITLQCVWCMHRLVCKHETKCFMNIQARARGRSPEGKFPCILQGLLMLYVFYMYMYITMTPYLPCNINRKELYDFYYTAITLTTEYNLYHNVKDRIAGIFRGYKCSWFSRIRHELRTLKPRI